MVHLRDLVPSLVRRQQWWSWTSDSDASSDGDSSVDTSAIQRVTGETTTVMVFVTLETTFSGPTAGFITQTADSQPSTVTTITPQITPTSSARSSATSASDTNSKPRSSSSVASKTDSSQSAMKTSHASTTNKAVVSTSSATQQATQPTQTSDADASASSTATAAPATSGTSGGVKAGIAAGIVVVLLLVAALVFFVIRRKKQQQKREAAFRGDDEKIRVSASRAPRLSLRPVTQFLPAIGDHKVMEMTTPTGVINSFPMAATQQHNAFDSRPASNASSDPSNPFGRSAETATSPVSASIPEVTVSSPDNAAPQHISPPAVVPQATPAVSSATQAANPFADKQTSSGATSPEQPVVSSSETSPTQPEFATAVALPTPAVAAVIAPAIAATHVSGSGSPPQSPTQQAGNVHRVQLDFRPSMDDELELRAGQVVRILHEYDDGWALCAYMDRSKQGVAPRSCLSVQALKPRPGGPPSSHQSGASFSRSGAQGYHNFAGPAPSQMLQMQNRDMYPAPLSPSMPNMSAYGRGTGISGRPRSQSQSQSHDMRQQQQQYYPDQRQPRAPSRSPQMLPSAGFGASPPRDHRRSASMGTMMHRGHNASNAGSGMGSLQGQFGRRAGAPGQAM